MTQFREHFTGSASRGQQLHGVSADYKGGVSADKLTRPQRYLERRNTAGYPFLLETASVVFLSGSALTQIVQVHFGMVC
jgi:hypothetical protein